MFVDAVCGLKTADLTSDAIKILGMYVLYHNETKTEQSFLSTVKNIQKALNVLNTRTPQKEGFLSIVIYLNY